MCIPLLARCYSRSRSELAPKQLGDELAEREKSRISGTARDGNWPCSGSQEDDANEDGKAATDLVKVIGILKAFGRLKVGDEHARLCLCRLHTHTNISTTKQTSTVRFAGVETCVIQYAER